MREVKDGYFEDQLSFSEKVRRAVVTGKTYVMEKGVDYTLPTADARVRAYTAIRHMKGAAKWGMRSTAVRGEKIGNRLVLDGFVFQGYTAKDADKMRLRPGRVAKVKGMSGAQANAETGEV